MSFPGFTYSSVNARIHTVTDSSFCAHQATGNVFFVWQWVDVTQKPKQLFISQWMQCLDTQIVSPQNVYFVMMTDTLNINVVNVDFSTPQVSLYTGLSTTLTGWQGFSTANLSNYSVGTSLIAGLTNQMYNSQANFSVGFVRLFPVLNDSGADMTFTEETVTATNLNYSGYSPNESLAPQITSNSYLGFSKMTVMKNEWINQFCAEIPHLKVKNSTCVFWEIFKVKVLESQLDLSNQYVPKRNISCPIEDTFDVSPLFTPIAKVCYPNAILPDDQFPSDKVTGEKLLNKVDNIYSWPPSLPLKLLSSEYLNQVKAQSDCLQESIFWFDFFSQKAKNTIILISKGKPLNFLAWNTWDQYEKSAAIMCWSLYCPSFLKFDYSSGKFFVSADDLCFKKTNQYVIIYQIDVFYSALPQEYTGFHNYSTVTFNVDCRPPIINITLPFDQYYKQFKNKIPYKMFPPESQQNKKFQSHYKELKTNYDPKSSNLNETDSWTEDDWTTAYAEAEVRATKLSTIVIVKTKMNNVGLVEINFNSDVFIPWYMLFNNTSGSASNSTNLRNRRLQINQDKNTYKISDKFSWFVLLFFRYLQEDAVDSVDENTADPAVDGQVDEQVDGYGDQSQADAYGADDYGGDSQVDAYGADVDTVTEDNSAIINVSIREGVEVTGCEPGFYLNSVLMTCVPMQVYFGKLKDLITFKLISYDDTAKGKDFTWKIQSASKRQIMIQLDFQQPLEIQTTDQIKIELNFQQFEQSMLPELPYQVSCIKQLPKGDAGKQLQQVVEQASVAVISTLVISVVMQTVMVGAMAQIWGMISGIQFMIWLPLLQFSQPANAQLVTQSILMVATFDIPKFNMADIFGDYWDLGDDDSILDIENTANEHVILLWNSLDQLGMSSRYASETFGSVFIIMLCSFFILVIAEFLFWWRKIIKLKRLRLLLKKQFLWNYFIRQQYQMTMEISICCYFNVYYGGIWGSDDDHAEQKHVTVAQVINYLFSGFLFFTILVQPIAILVFYSCNYKSLDETKFKNKYGTVYEGYKPNQSSAVLMPFFYTARRLLLAVCIIYLTDFAWMQFFIMIYSTLFTACYILHAQPCEYRGYLEVMNEVTLLFLINLSLNFTDLQLDQETQYTAGWLYIFVFCGTIAVHLSLIILDGMRDLVRKIKRKILMSKRKLHNNQVNNRKDEEQVIQRRAKGLGKMAQLRNLLSASLSISTPNNKKKNKSKVTRQKRQETAELNRIPEVSEIQESSSSNLSSKSDFEIRKQTDLKILTRNTIQFPKVPLLEDEIEETLAKLGHPIDGLDKVKKASLGTNSHLEDEIEATFARFGQPIKVKYPTTSLGMNFQVDYDDEEKVQNYAQQWDIDVRDNFLNEIEESQSRLQNSKELK